MENDECHSMNGINEWNQRMEGISILLRASKNLAESVVSKKIGEEMGEVDAEIERRRCRCRRRERYKQGTHRMSPAFEGAAHFVFIFGISEGMFRRAKK